MSIFVSPQDYIMQANECEQLECEIYGHEYKMWCKKDKIEQARDIVEKVKPYIDKLANKSKMLSFDKVLFMALIDLLAKDKDFQLQPKQEQQSIETKTEFDAQLAKQKEDLINNFISILQQIQQSLNG